MFLVDDDEIDTITIKRALKSRVQTGEIDLEVFHDGEAVINRLEEMHKRNLYADKTMPHFMVLDLNMPRMNGFEVLEKIRNDPKYESMVVFILSTSNNPEKIKRTYRKNVAGYLVKGEMGNRYEKLSNFFDTYSDTVTLHPN